MFHDNVNKELNNTTNNHGDANKMHAHNHAIKCNVTNCYYNDQHFCAANAIEVNAMGDGHADTSDGTACSTFVDK
ncbi:MAG: hypothetical protein K0R80_2073 [Clostridia bacterium]|jgi:hypothetical protein|nr:hypothetical protein [Clostridia bacterium]